MDGMEMKNFKDAARVTEKLADFAGCIIMQLLQRQGYVEEKGVKALLSHVRGGGGTLTASVSEGRAGELKELLKEAHIPFVEIARTDSETKERTVFFVYRDSDRDRAGEVMREFAMRIDKSCHEVDLETFAHMTEGKPYGMVSGLTREEIYAFREAAGEKNIRFCVVADGSHYGIVADSRLALADALGDMCRNLSGEKGHEYAAALERYLQQQDSLVERMRPEPGRVKYLVSAKNPSIFLSVDERGIVTHSVGILRQSVGQEPQPGGTIQNEVGDIRYVRYPGYSGERLRRLAEEIHNPVILSQEEFSSMVEEIGENGEAVLSQNFVQEFEPFVKRMKDRGEEFLRMPVRSVFRGEEEPMPEELKAIEREAAERRQKMEIMERVMNREAADRMRDRKIDRKMAQEPER